MKHLHFLCVLWGLCLVCACVSKPRVATADRDAFANALRTTMMPAFSFQEKTPKEICETLFEAANNELNQQGFLSISVIFRPGQDTDQNTRRTFFLPALPIHDAMSAAADEMGFDVKCENGIFIFTTRETVPAPQAPRIDPFSQIFVREGIP